MTRIAAYRTTTAVTAFVLFTGGLAYVFHAAYAVDGVVALGYPGYLVTILGIWKLLGVPAILVPGFARLKEWAYAGIAFDLSGAAVSHLVMGSPYWHVVITLGLLAVAAVSWALRPAGRTLPGPAVDGERLLARA